MLQGNCRSEDIPCRYGGEEFMLILPETDLGTAMQRAQEIRRAAEAMSVPYLQHAIGGITVSIGIALFPLHAIDGTELKRLADAALYRAKRNGRNRVEVAVSD
jgi:diguanylate cyclase (GGDEF)-like protein